jgi:hypothetical protein
VSKIPSPPLNGDNACPRCGQKFTCGLAAAQERCWCFDLPHVIPMTDANREGCLCPACLKAEIDRQLTLRKQNEAGV